ncbi:MAG: hypothetical protein L0956_09785, partial [Candidatus Mariimomonas ferrooxydans]
MGCLPDIVKKDRPVGLVLYLSLVIIVDWYLDTGIYIPGMEYGSIKYSEVIACFLLMNNPTKRPLEGTNKLIIFMVFAFFMLLLLSSFRGYLVSST